MAYLVNDTGKRNLSVKNQEPTHLSMATHDDLGGATIDSEPNSVKIDAAKGVSGRDTTVKGSGQLSEPTHLKAANEDELDPEDVSVDFGDERDVHVDSIDEALAQFEEVEIELDGDDEDEKKKDVKEGIETEGDEERGENNAKTKASFGPVDAAVASGPNKETGDNAVNEGELPPWLKKKDGDKDEDEKAVVKEGEEIVIKDGGDKDDDKDKKNPFEKKDKVDSGREKLGESVKLKVTLPKSNLFESVGLSKKAQTQVGVVFESALKDVTKQVSSQLHKHYKAVMESKVEGIKRQMTEQADQYLNYVVEEWMKTNKVNVRQSLRVQMAEDFLDGLHKLFKEHYINIPDNKVDVVEELTQQVKSLKTALNEQHSKTVALREVAVAANKARIVSDHIRTTNMSEATANKFQKLAEGVGYTNAKQFRGKLAMLQESLFNGDGGSKGAKPVTVTDEKGGRVVLKEGHLPEAELGKSTVLTEEGSKTRTSSGDADIDIIAATLSRQAKTEADWK